MRRVISSNVLASQTMLWTYLGGVAPTGEEAASKNSCHNASARRCCGDAGIGEHSAEQPKVIGGQFAAPGLGGQCGHRSAYLHAPRPRGGFAACQAPNVTHHHLGIGMAVGAVEAVVVDRVEHRDRSGIGPPPHFLDLADGVD